MRVFPDQWIPRGEYWPVPREWFEVLPDGVDLKGDSGTAWAVNPVDYQQLLRELEAES